MFIRLLGEVSVGDDQDARPVPGRVAAAVLAQLALAGGRTVSVESLIDGVWREPTDTARNAVQVAVSKLRKLLGPELVDGSRAGYRLRVDLVRVDWAEAEQLLAKARQDLDGSRFRVASQAAAIALALFVGEPLGGLGTPHGETAQLRAVELRRSLTVVRARALLGERRHGEAVALLQEQVNHDWLNEPAHALLMQALAADGRAADALEVFDRLRRRLAMELGTDPSGMVSEVFARVLAGELGPAASLDSARSTAGGPRELTLPAVGSPLLGRDEEVQRLARLITGGYRLVTLLGPGGIGKTRLAIEVARTLAGEQARPAVLVDLTLAREPHEMLPTLADALDTDVESVPSVLESTRTLLVLDNAEHLLEPVAQLASTLLGVDGIDLLVTSRSPLRLRAERTVDLDGLTGGEVTAPAVRLLADRAGLHEDEVSAHAQALIELARRIDGVPLVLELLASALRWRTPEQLLDELEDTLITAFDDSIDRPQRHSSIAAAVDWSVQRATEPACRGLSALAIIRGSFTEPTAAALLTAAAPDTPPRTVLAELIDLSLVQRLHRPGSVRFRLLEPVRLHTEYAPDACPPDATVHRAHALQYLGALQSAHEGYAKSSNAFNTLIRQEDANLSQALQWTWKHDPSLAMQHLSALLYGWFWRSRYDEVGDWCARGLSSPAGTSQQHLQLMAVWLTSLIEQASPNQAQMRQLSERLEAYAEDFDDEWHRRWVMSQTLLAQLDEDYELALCWTERFRPGSRLARSSACLTRSLVFADLGRWEEAHDAARAGLTDASSEHDADRVALLSAAGYTALIIGRLRTAREAFEEALDRAVACGMDFELGVAELNLAWLALASGNPSAALQRVADTTAVPRGRTETIALPEGLLIAGLALLELGKCEQARLLASAVTRRVNDIAGFLDPFMNSRLDHLAAATGIDVAKAADLPVDDLIQVIQDAARDIRRQQSPGDGGQADSRD